MARETHSDEHYGAHRMKLYMMAIALMAATVWLGFKARNEAKQYDYIGIPLTRNVISVGGQGKVVGIPDIAHLDLGTQVERPTVSAAQTENTRVMNQLIADLKASGIADADIQTTGYQVYPNYDYNTGKQTLRSYSVTQNVHVKVRKIDSVGDLLAKAGSLGANQLGGIRFDVDDPEALKDEARAKAIADAREKAEALGRAMDVEIVRIVSFNESSGGYQPPVFARDSAGMGGAEAQSAAPTIQAGSNEIIVNVNIEYEIR